MGFFDAIKKAFGGVTNEVQNQMNAATAAPVQHHHEPEPEPDHGHDDHMHTSSFDVAGFDANDEDSFFNAVLNIESAGEKMGATDETPEQVMARFGVRNHSHWQDVKASMYQLLAQKHGSMDAVMQQEMNFRMGQVQRNMQNRVSAAAASGELNPVEGITLDFWAATNAALVQGASLDDLLKGAGVDRARWDRAKGEWEARMARDTTFAIAQVYGAAFQNASTGQYAAYGKEATAARAANRDLSMQPPITLEKYFDILFEQSAATAAGKDATATLKSLGLSIVDWCDVSTFMGYHIYRTYAGTGAQKLSAMMDASKAKAEAKYGAKADVDIAF